MEKIVKKNIRFKNIKKKQNLSTIFKKNKTKKRIHFYCNITAITHKVNTLLKQKEK